MKIEKISFNDTAEMVIEHPVTGEPLADGKGGNQTITLFGIQSQQYRKAKHDNLNNRLNKRSKTVAAEQAEDDAAELLAACTKSFNRVDFGGGPIDTKSAKETYLAHAWLINQVDEFVADNKSFLVESKVS